MVILVPYPNNQAIVKTDFDLQGDCLVWYARPQLFFNCTLCAAVSYRRQGVCVQRFSLMYFSPFEPIELTPDSTIQEAGGSAWSPCSMSRPATGACHVLTRLHLPSGKRAGARALQSVLHWRQQSPYYDSTIPHRFKDDQRLGSASTDKQRDLGNGSRLYKVNIWMWSYCRGLPRIVSIAEAERIRSSVSERAGLGSGRQRRGGIAARTLQQLNSSL
jgi:hypothetical protein